MKTNGSTHKVYCYSVLAVVERQQLPNFRPRVNLTCTLKPVRFGATSDLKRKVGELGGTGSTQRSGVNSIDSGLRANFNMPISFHKHIPSEQSTRMVGLGLYKFGCRAVPVSNRRLYMTYVWIHAKNTWIQKSALS